MEKLEGKIKEVICYQNGFGVVKIQFGKTSRKAVGEMPQPFPGRMIYMNGEWETDAKWGRQFKIKYARIDEVNVQKENIVNYLKSGFLHGVGPAVAQKIYDMFGDRTEDILKETPERLCEIPGITKMKAEKIGASYRETKQYIPLASYLCGATKHQIEVIYQFYGEHSVTLLKENIYKIVDDINGIGFQKADKLATNCGIKADASIRIRAAILYVMRDISRDGHCFITCGSLDGHLRDLLKMPIHSKKVETELKSLIAENKIINEEGNIYLADIYQAECQCAEDIRRIWTSPANRTVPVSWYQKATMEIEQEQGFALTAEQKSAVKKGMENKILLLTGGPGSGKTTTINALLRAWGHPESVLILAPTGCAAYRLHETTGQRAYTIHKGLHFGYHNEKMCFEYNSDNRLPYDFIILDEATMPNVVLFSALLQSIRSGARLVLVGDHDQLPAIGPGKVFEDLLNSGRLPVVRLQIGHRQTSDINRIVTKINQGNGMHTWGLEHTDQFMYYNAETTEEIENIVVEEFKRLVCEYGIENVRCLTVMKGRMVGYKTLNPRLRDAIYQQKKQTDIILGDQDYYTGDRIIYQKENDYTKGVYNGELGTIKVIDPARKEIGVMFDDGRKVIFRGRELRNLELSYATSIHKSMGSECKAVVIAYCAQPKMLLRNLLYTAVSRAKCEVVLVGSYSAIDTSLKIVSPERRNTRLKYRIKV